jgi:hypothetical protein
LRAWSAEQPQSQPRRTVAKFALERAVKEDPSLRGLFADAASAPAMDTQAKRSKQKR